MRASAAAQSSPPRNVAEVTITPCAGLRTVCAKSSPKKVVAVLNPMDLKLIGSPDVKLIIDKKDVRATYEKDSGELALEIW